MVKWTGRARKDLATLPDKMQPKVKQIVADVDANRTQGKKLKGKLQGTLSVRLGRSHRILYKFVDSDLIVLTIGQRKDVYR